MMRGSENWGARGVLIVAACVVACALSAAPADANARCHGSFPNFLGYSYYRLDVTVYYHRNMTCSQAVALGRRGYALPGLRVIRDAVFGGGGFGGPFKVGHFGCFLTARGSDFRLAYCAGGRQAIFFYGHRDTVTTRPAASDVPRMPISGGVFMHAVSRPRIVVLVGDGSEFLGGYKRGHYSFTNIPANHLDWTTWNSTEGVARGGAWIDNQKPSVGAGMFGVYRVTVRVYRPIRGVFTRMLVSSQHRLHYWGKRFTAIAQRGSGGWSWAR